MKTKAEAMAHAFADLALKVAAEHGPDSPISIAAARLGEAQEEAIAELQLAAVMRDRLQMAALQMSIAAEVLTSIGEVTEHKDALSVAEDLRAAMAEIAQLGGGNFDDA